MRYNQRMTLPDYLKTLDPSLAKALTAIADATAEISDQIRTADTSAAGSTNTFGEEQLTLDVLADQLIFTKLKESGVVATASSEEQATSVSLNPPNKGGSSSEAGAGGFSSKQFSVAFDPLDGSSLVDVNLAVGTIWGIWPSSELLNRTGSEQVAAGYAVYGPRTTLVIATDTVSEFTLQKSPPDKGGDSASAESGGLWQQTGENLQISEGKLFAPGNLRATADNAGYRKLIDYWQSEKYTLRYSGGMVPDVHQILRKGKGVFSYPGSESAPAKLRLLYECAPLARVIEAAGGASSDGSQSILNAKIEAYDQRIPVCLGSKAEVQRFEEYLK